MRYGTFTVKKILGGSSPLEGVLKFKADGVARGDPGPVSIRGVLCNKDELVLAMFSEHVGMVEFNEAEVLAVLEALRIFVLNYHDKLAGESNPLNAIPWCSSLATLHWRYLNKIKSASLIQGNFKHIGRSANVFAYALAKQGVNRFFFFFRWLHVSL